MSGKIVKQILGGLTLRADGRALYAVPPSQVEDLEAGVYLGVMETPEQARELARRWNELPKLTDAAEALLKLDSGSGGFARACLQLDVACQRARGIEGVSS